MSSGDCRPRPRLAVRGAVVATVQHGLPEDLLTPQPLTPSYLAFLGRISPEKRPDCAIRTARRAGLPLKIAAKVDRADGTYFQDVMRSAAARWHCWCRSTGPCRSLGDDRGDGLRHAGDRVRPRLGAGDRRTWP